MTIADHPAPEDIQSFADGELSLEEARRVETHMATCAECAGILDGLRHVSRRMNEWRIDAPTGLVAPPGRPAAGAMPLWMRRGWQMAAVLVLGVGLVWVGRSSNQPSTDFSGTMAEMVGNAVL